MAVKTDKPQKIDLGSIIKSHRKKKHFTQQQLARTLGISYQLLQNYEYNKCRPSLERLLDLSKILGIDIKTMYLL